MISGKSCSFSTRAHALNGAFWPKDRGSSLCHVLRTRSRGFLNLLRHLRLVWILLIHFRYLWRHHIGCTCLFVWITSGSFLDVFHTISGDSNMFLDQNPAMEISGWFRDICERQMQHHFTTPPCRSHLEAWLFSQFRIYNFRTWGFWETFSALVRLRSTIKFTSTGGWTNQKSVIGRICICQYEPLHLPWTFHFVRLESSGINILMKYSLLTMSASLRSSHRITWPKTLTRLDFPGFMTSITVIAVISGGCRVISSVDPITELDKCGSEWSQW